MTQMPSASNPATPGISPRKVDPGADDLLRSVGLLNEVGIAVTRTAVLGAAAARGLARIDFSGQSAYGLDGELVVVRERRPIDSENVSSIARGAYDLLSDMKAQSELLSAVYRLQRDAGVDLANYIRGKSPVPVLLHQQAMAHFRDGRPWEAEGLLRECLGKNKHDAASHAALARVLLRLGKPLGNKDDFESPADHFYQATQWGQDQPHAWVDWARAARQAYGPGSLDERYSARWLFNQGFESSLHPSVIRAWAMMEQELEKEGERNPDPSQSARSLYRCLVIVAPGDGDAWYSWAIHEANVLNNLGEENEEGTACWLAALACETDPGNAAAWVARADLEVLAVESDRDSGAAYDRAYTFLEEAERCNPSMGQVYSTWLKILRHEISTCKRVLGSGTELSAGGQLKNRLAKAQEQVMDVLERAVEAMRKSGDTKYLAGHLANTFDERQARGKGAQGAREPTQAKILAAACDADPTNHRIWSRRGWWWSTRKEPDLAEADRCFQLALELKPSGDTVRRAASHLLGHDRPDDVPLKLLASTRRKCEFFMEKPQEDGLGIGAEGWDAILRQLHWKWHAHPALGMGLEFVRVEVDSNRRNFSGLRAQVPWGRWAWLDAEHCRQMGVGAEEFWSVRVLAKPNGLMLLPIRRVDDELISKLAPNLADRARKATTRRFG